MLDTPSEMREAQPVPPPPALRERPVKHTCCPSPGRDRAWLPVPPLATLGEGLDTGSRVVEVAGGLGRRAK